MSLDINTEKGQESLRYEKEMLDHIRSTFCNNHRTSLLIETDKEKESKVDGIIVKNNQVSGIFESKCRNMSLMELQNYGSWLVTFDKIMDGKNLSKLLCVPFVGFLYLIKDKIVMYWKITDSKGEFEFDFEIKKTKTRKTINGGEAIRTNAYLPVKYGHEII